MTATLRQTVYRISVQALCLTCGHGTTPGQNADQPNAWVELHASMNPGHTLTVTTTTVAAYETTERRLPWDRPKAA